MPAFHLDWAAMTSHVQMHLVLNGEIDLTIAGATSSSRSRQLLRRHPSAPRRPHGLAQAPARLCVGPGDGETGCLSGVRHHRRSWGHPEHLPYRSHGKVDAATRAKRSKTPGDMDAFDWSRRTYDFLMTWWREADEAAERSRDAAGLIEAAADRGELPRARGRVAVKAPLPLASRVLDAPPKTVQEMADRLGYSRSHLSEVVSRTWNESPGAVLRRDRLQRGAEWLRRGETVKAAAEAAGYATHQAFSRAYRKHFGQLPSTQSRGR